MTYATQANLADRFGEAMLVALTDRGAVATGTIDAAVIDRALADTDAMIDASVSRLYQMPLTTVPPRLVDLALQIAIYKLHVNMPDEKITRDYDAAVKTLDKIADGSERIPAAGIEPASSGAQGVRTTDRERPFTEASMKGFI